ncbi:MAG: hypothetical protein ACI9U2_000618 [Bradymonadia bacterium]|jgi:hypothetical protein
MMMLWMTLLLGLARPGAALQGAEAVLRAGDDVGLMRAVDSTRIELGSAVTRVERVAVIDGSPPVRAEVVQRGAQLHQFKAGALVLMPLLRDGDGWVYRCDARRALQVEPRTQRQAIAFARRWRRREPRAPEQSVGEWINLLSHPAQVARRIGHEALVEHADRLRSSLSEAQLDRLMVPLTMAGIPEDDHLARVRMMGLLGGQRGARRLAAVFDQLASDRVRRMAVGVMSRFPHASAKAAMRRCAVESVGSLKMRCDRVMQRIDGPSPTLR